MISVIVLSTEKKITETPTMLTIFSIRRLKTICKSSFIALLALSILLILFPEFSFSCQSRSRSNECLSALNLASRAACFARV